VSTQTVRSRPETRATARLQGHSLWSRARLRTLRRTPPGLHGGRLAGPLRLVRLVRSERRAADGQGHRDGRAQIGGLVLVRTSYRSAAPLSVRVATSLTHRTARPQARGSFLYSVAHGGGARSTQRAWKAQKQYPDFRFFVRVDSKVDIHRAVRRFREGVVQRVVFFTQRTSTSFLGSMRHPTTGMPMESEIVPLKSVAQRSACHVEEDQNDDQKKVPPGPISDI
jgi:hypothetical protein